MARDFTDYVALILEAEKRVYHLYHFREKENKDKLVITHNGREFDFAKRPCIPNQVGSLEKDEHPQTHLDGERAYKDEEGRAVALSRALTL